MPKLLAFCPTKSYLKFPKPNLCRHPVDSHSIHLNIEIFHSSQYWKDESESCSVMSNSLGPHGHSPWNSWGQNTRVDSLSLLQGIFPTQGSNPGLPHFGQILYQLSHKGKVDHSQILPSPTLGHTADALTCLRLTVGTSLLGQAGVGEIGFLGK